MAGKQESCSVGEKPVVGVCRIKLLPRLPVQEIGIPHLARRGAAEQRGSRNAVLFGHVPSWLALLGKRKRSRCQQADRIVLPFSLLELPYLHRL
ncbi:hypothetical protein D3C80_757770 [compost metagenome]